MVGLVEMNKSETILEAIGRGVNGWSTDIFVCDFACRLRAARKNFKQGSEGKENSWLDCLDDKAAMLMDTNPSLKPLLHNEEVIF